MAEDGTQQRYAVLGWGSLIWDLDTLAPHVRLPWAMGAGPRLPMEFSRVSPKRRMGLVVCLDPAGVPCPTHAVASTRGRLDRAIAESRAPRAGAGTPDRRRLPRHGGACQGRKAIVVTVRDWCRGAGWTGAVWTDLLPNYAEMLGEAFSIERGHAYLQTLAGESLDEAVRYIENAPAATDTPLRRRLNTDPWVARAGDATGVGARLTGATAAADARGAMRVRMPDAMKTPAATSYDARDLQRVDRLAEEDGAADQRQDRHQRPRRRPSRRHRGRGTA